MERILEDTDFWETQAPEQGVSLAPRTWLMLLFLALMVIGLCKGDFGETLANGSSL